MSLRRLAVLAGTVLVMLGAMSLLTMAGTPAAQRQAQRIEPYDPLK